MANISITFPNEAGVPETFDVTYADAYKGKIVPVLARNRGFQAEIPNVDYRPALPEGPDNLRTIPNPASMAQFVAQKLVDQLVQEAMQAEIAEQTRIAQEQIRQAAMAAINVSVAKAE